jgi:hypothetical protein
MKHTSFPSGKKRKFQQTYSYTPPANQTETMTEDRPDQPDATPNFNCLTEDALMGIQFKDNQEVWSAISRVKQQLELLWKDYVLPVKEENKRLTDRVGDLLDETKQRSKTYTLLREEVEESQKQIEGLKEENKQLREALEISERDLTLVIMERDEFWSELSKKGEPINSELLATLKDAEKYCDDPEASKRFLAVIERAESTPLVKQSGDLWLIQRDGNSTEVFKNGERIEVPKDFDPLQLHLKTKSVEPVKSLQEEMLVILEEICETYPEYYDNPVGPYEYSCVFCSAMIGIKGGEPSVAMDDLPHQEHCTYTKAKTLLKKISPPIE